MTDNAPVFVTGAIVGLVAALTLGSLGPGEEAIRMILRCSARLSFALFLVVFSTGPLHSLLRNSVTERLLTLRRSLGLSFALAHACAGLCIVLYASYYHDSFMHETYPLQRIGGSVGFAAIAVMTLTSLDRFKRMIAPATWKLVHTTCLYFVLLNFTVSFGRRTLLLKNSFYLPFFACLLAAVVLRAVAGYVRVRRNVQQPS